MLQLRSGWVGYAKEHWSYLTTAGNYPGIDGLRFLAITFVLLYHAGYLVWGWIGVDLFFVISGFLIGGELIDRALTDRLSFGEFYLHRALRILPVYYFFILLSFLFRAHCRIDATTLPSVLSAITFFQMAGPYYWGWHINFAYIPEGTWTLAIEEMFYLAAPLVLWSLSRWTRDLRTMALVLGVVFLTGIPARLWATAGFLPDDPNWHFASYIQFHSRYDELVAGVAAAAAMRDMKGHYARYPCWALACLALGLFLSYIYAHPAFLAEPQTITRATIWLPTVLGLGFGALVLAIYDVPVDAVFVIGGARLSYGLYLMINFLPYNVPHFEAYVPSYVALISLFVSSVALTYALSLFVEYPFIRLYRRPRPEMAAHTRPPA